MVKALRHSLAISVPAVNFPFLIKNNERKRLYTFLVNKQPPKRRDKMCVKGSCSIKYIAVYNDASHVSAIHKDRDVKKRKGKCNTV